MIPPVFDKLYAQLDAKVGGFGNTIRESWDGSHQPVHFAAPLSSANANVSATFTSPWHYSGVLMERDGLAALGITTMVVEIPFPVFDRAYYATDAAFQHYLDFYRQVAADIRARGLMLVADATFLLARSDSGAYKNPGEFYRSMSWEEYCAGRAEHAATVLSVMQPDWLVVLQEPDTEALATGFKQAATPDGATSLLTTVLKRIDAVRGPTRIGAGIGSWQIGHPQFIDRFTATAIDFVDLHVFEANFDFLPNCIEIADRVAARGKSLAISGAWLTKSSDAEVLAIATGRVTDHQVVSRDAFDFWAPLDLKFLEAFFAFTHWKSLQFFAPFFVQNLRAYLTYAPALLNLTPTQINALMQQAHVDALSSGAYTSTGVGYSRSIVGLDSARPNPPTDGAAVIGRNGTTLFWQGATDNVGVAGYEISRRGVPIGRTSRTYWMDPSQARERYEIRAFDVVGQQSEPLTLRA